MNQNSELTKQEELKVQESANRIAGIQRYKGFQAQFPWFFNELGQLKNKMKNRHCPCESGEKVKNCHGIKYI